MKIILAVAVVSCFLAVGTALFDDCTTRLVGLASCISRSAAAAVGGDNYAFCRECGNPLVSYINDCGTDGVGLAAHAIQQSKLLYEIIQVYMIYKPSLTVCPNATDGSSTIHTITAFLTALALTGVAMLTY